MNGFKNDRPPVILSIAGSDPSGGAGIQADIRTAAAFGVYCATAVTSVTVQNTFSFYSLNPVSPELICSQIKAVFEDCMPDAIKIGLLPDVKAVNSVYHCLLPYASDIPIVLDPVLVPSKDIDNDSAGKGVRKYDDDFVAALGALSELCLLTTPNLPEYETLFAADAINSGYMLLKGGHTACQNESVDTIADKLFFLCNTERFSRHFIKYTPVSDYIYPRLDTGNTHGTGCVLSSAIASALAMIISGAESDYEMLGTVDIQEAIKRARDFLFDKLKTGTGIRYGSGYGPAFMV